MGEGSAYVYDGSQSGVSSARPLTHPAPRANGAFGNAIATAGDLNGDGYQDLAVGAYLANAEVYVYFGSPSGIAPTPDATLRNPLAAAFSAFGWVVAPGGDLNGDGFDDLVVGAQSQDRPTSTEGAVFVYFGSAEGVTTPPVVIESPSLQPQGQFGFAVSAADVDGDGLPDLLVGAPGVDGTTARQGVAYVFRGRSTGVERAPYWTLEHPDPAVGGEFGRAVALGDLDGDGHADLLVGAPFSSDGAPDAGTVWAFRGGSGSEPPGPVRVARPVTQAAAFFGEAIGFLGDVNGDGFGDVGIGANGAHSPADTEGLVVIVFGAATFATSVGDTRLVLPLRSTPRGRFGWSLSGCDVNADGLADLVVGAPGERHVDLLRGSPGAIGTPLGAPVSVTGAAGFGRAVGRCW